MPESTFQFASRRTRALTCSRLAQSLDNSSRPTLLRKTQNRINEEQRAHHGQIREFMQDSRQHHDELKHPGRQTPELRKELENRMLLLLYDFVKAVLCATRLYLDLGV